MTDTNEGRVYVADLNRDALEAARRWAGWHLGSRAWADDLLAVYFNPVSSMEQLDKEMR